VGEEKEERPAIGTWGRREKEGSAAAAGRSRRVRERERKEGEREEKAWDSVVQ